MQAGKKIRRENERELTLLRRVAEEDREALTRLFRIYHARLFRFVFRLTGSYGTADELVNDIMLLVWRKAATFRGESRVSTWIFGIAYRQTMRRVTRKQLRVSTNMDLDGFASDDDAAVETEDWVSHGLRSLPATQQLAVVLVFYLGLSYEETAEVMQCPVNTIKTRMFHARRKLREFLAASASPNETTIESSHD